MATATVVPWSRAPSNHVMVCSARAPVCAWLCSPYPGTTLSAALPWLRVYTSYGMVWAVWTLTHLNTSSRDRAMDVTCMQCMFSVLT